MRENHDEPSRWHFYCIDPGLPHKRIGSMIQITEAIAGMIGHSFESKRVKYLCVAAFAIGPDRQLLWNPRRGRYIFDHEVHFLRVPDDDATE